ncbi:uncharacterized protein LOC134285538 [Aedes albopictus]|uniref:Odorant receptor n=1 Tax=Aedes albopictus TaxID=7160 RepID=A0ABM1YDJ4_AEDAL
MKASLRGSFPANIILPQVIPFIDRIQDPLALQKVMDRCFGVINWDSQPIISFAKSVSLFFMFSYYIVCCFCALFFINPAEVTPDIYLNMWFYCAASAFCSLQWIVLFPSRHYFSQIVEYLTDIHRQDPFHPFRIRSRSMIFLSTAFLLTMNTCMAIFWSFLLYGSCPIAGAFRNPTVKLLSSMIYPVQSIHMATISNCAMVTCFAVLLVFTVEFDIVGEAFREAFSSWNSAQVRNCIERHRRLLQMVNLFRDHLRLYLLIAVGLYILLVTFTCFLLVVQLHAGDIQAMRYNVINAAFSIMTIVMYGVVCDLLEDRIREVGQQVYNAEWPSKLILNHGHRGRYLSGKSCLVMVIARSQKKVGFTCGNIYQMSTVTSMQVLKLCYTGFTVLWNATNR